MNKISLIVPVYNVSKYLNKCIDSILKQTYKNLEIILIDDGSTDESPQICDEYAKKDQRIRVYHEKNKGLSATRNQGIRVSTGEFLAFIDSDDTITEDYCETLLNAILLKKADVASASLVMTRESGYVIETSDDIKESEHNSKLKVYNKRTILKEVLLRKSFKNYVCTKLYRRELFDSCLFKENICYEDVLFTYEMSKYIKKIVYVNKVCYNYLKRENSITATCSEKNLNDFLDVILYRYNDVYEKNLNYQVYNLFALLESIISISVKYVIAGRKYKTVAKKSTHIFSIITKALKNKSLEAKLLPLLNKSQKACLYLILYNHELFYNFLEVRQDMKVMGLL